MYRQALKYILYSMLGVSLILVTRVKGDNRIPEISQPENKMVLNLEPIDHFYFAPELHNLVDTARNNISGNLDCLTPLMDKLLALRSGEDSIVNILHIGDSHVQAGFWTARLRELFQHDFGNAGRGLILPYKLSGSNEPRNYYIRTGEPYHASKVTANNSGEVLGFTGVGIAFEDSQTELEIWSRNPFNSITLFHHELAPMLSPPEHLSLDTYCTIDNTNSSTRIVFSETVDTVLLRGHNSDIYNNPLFFGMSLENGNPGVLYHGIGSNGAAFEHFLNHTNITDGGASVLNPDLIIVSLGTNNCYGSNYKSRNLYNVIENFITKLQENYPAAAILMTTPRESCRRDGRRGYKPNPNIADAAELITKIVSEKELVCWDFYNAAGGKNISEKWFSAGLSGKDRIHLTESGYIQAGDMFYDAFVKHYNQWLEKKKTGNSV